MKPVLLIILDGYGIASPGPGNAISLAKPNNLNTYLYTYPNTTLKASGEAVGLPSGEVGNTEVGHLNMGAGRIVYQDLPRINMSVADGNFYKNPAFIECLDHVKKHQSKLHLLGLISEGSVHSSIEHLYALLYFCKEQKINDVFIHAFTDGRDSPPRASIDVVKKVEEKMQQNGVGKIASISGRYFAMDRDLRWDRTEKAYKCITEGTGQKAASAIDAIKKSYTEGKSDEFIEPTNITSSDKPLALVEDNDAVIFFNYRIDRPRQLSKAFVLDHFESEANVSKSFDPYLEKYYKSHLAKEPAIQTPPFQRTKKIENLFFVTMTEYEKGLPAKTAFPPIAVEMPLGRVISERGLTQLRMSESEKERFVTIYFNGLREKPFPNEDRVITPSPSVPTYDLKPEMSAYEQTNILLGKIREKKYAFILINFANPDMVGHTGNIQATVQAINVVDECTRKIVNEGLVHDYQIIITADHGNAEQKINPQTGEISTEHTSNQVPFIAISKELQGHYVKLQSGILGDVAATVLALLGVPKPENMTGRNLLEEIK
jgi:2,3-bisphosphoglycerate-independent phosphoglycerate mutase